MGTKITKETQKHIDEIEADENETLADHADALLRVGGRNVRVGDVVARVRELALLRAEVAEAKAAWRALYEASVRGEDGGR